LTTGKLIRGLKGKRSRQERKFHILRVLLAVTLCSRPWHWQQPDLQRKGESATGVDGTHGRQRTKALHCAV